MTIAIWILDQIVLMVFFRDREVLKRKQFGEDRFVIFLCQIIETFLNDFFIGFIDVVDTSAVLMTDIVSLLI